MPLYRANSYLVNIGTPPQQVFVQLDTGSFELWVNPDCSGLQGSSDIRFCNAVGQYDPSSSSSSVQLTAGKTLTYGIGSANIRYVIDSIGLAGTGAKDDSVTASCWPLYF